MARLRDGRHASERSLPLSQCWLELLIGPVPGGPTDDELKLAWELHGDQVMDEDQARPGTRPWGFWRFEVGEDVPRKSTAAETLRLAELALLEPWELAALRERANEAGLRVGTERERISGGNRRSGVSVDAGAVELWEAVEEAMRR